MQETKRDLREDENIKREIIMKDTKIILIIIIATLQLGSCISLNSLKENDELKNAILKSDLLYSEMLFFPTEEEEQVGYITIFNLRRNLLNDKKYDNCDLDSLLSEALKGNHSFSCSELERCFKPSSIIEKSYKKLSLKSFLEKFTQYFDIRNYFMIHDELTQNEKETVAYFLYLNGHYTTYDDYENRYFLKKGFRFIRDDELEDIDLIITEE